MAVDSSRSRFTGTAETLAAVLSKHITKVDSLKYDDDFSKARVQPHLVLKHTPLWEDCHDLCENLSFTQSTAKQAFKIVRETHDFKLTDKDSRDWDTTLATRLRAQGKHINSAQIRNINTKWLRNFSWIKHALGLAKDLDNEKKEQDDDDEQPTAAKPTAAKPSSTVAKPTAAKGDDGCSDFSPEGSEEEDKEEEEEEDCSEEEEPPVGEPAEQVEGMCWWYGWDHELGQAFRSRPDGSQYELATKVVLREGCHDADPIDAIWADGQEHAIAELTVGEYKAAKPSAVTKSACYWKGEHCKTGQALTLKHRQDRCALVSLQVVGGPQILQHKRDDFDDPDQVVAFMTKIAVEYAADKVELVQLKAHKEEVLRGLRSVRKRPAASTGASAASTGAPAASTGASASSTGASASASSGSKAKVAKKKGEAASTSAPASSEGSKAKVAKEKDEDPFDPFAGMDLPPHFFLFHSMD
jgi:hypothetical protein